VKFYSHRNCLCRKISSTGVGAVRTDYESSQTNHLLKYLQKYATHWLSKLQYQSQSDQRTARLYQMVVNTFTKIFNIRKNVITCWK